MAEEEEFMADQAIAAAGIVRDFADVLGESYGQTLRAAADFMERHGRGGRAVRVSL